MSDSGERTEARPDLLERLGRRVEARATRVVLAVVIIASLLPALAPLETQVAPVLVAIFGAELVIRVALLLRRPAWQRRRLDWGLVGVDLAAFLSFLPLASWLPPEWQGGPLVIVPTLLRLARLLVLLRFARALVRDLWAIVTRREQLQQFLLVTSAVATLSFVTAVVLWQVHPFLAHDYDGNGVRGDEGFLDHLWWAFRQLESADNLVAHLRTDPFVVVVSLTLTITGVFVISFVIGLGTNIVEQVILTERRRPVGYAGHALVVGPIHANENLVREFVRIYDKNRKLRRVSAKEIWHWIRGHAPMPRRHALPRMALLGPAEEAPGYLYDADMRWVVYRQGEGANADALERVGAAHAKRVMLLARTDVGADSDAVTVATLGAIRAANRHAHVFVEVSGSHNRDIVLDVGGPGTFCLDVSKFLGLFLCQHLVVPGIEFLYRDLLNADGAEFYTHIYTSQRELEVLAKLGDADGLVDFDTMAREAYRTHRVVLVGVFLGDGPVRDARAGLVPVTGLAQWLNPEADARADGADSLADFGVRPGRVPAKALRGLVAVCESYLPLRHYARSLVRGDGLAKGGRPEVTPAAASLVDRIEVAPLGPKRVLVVGFSQALAPLVRELSRFVLGVEVLLVLGARGDERTSLPRRLASLELGIREREALPGDGGRELGLERGGRITVFTHEGSDLAAFAARTLRHTGPVDAAVFLAEPDAVDRDARTAMRVLRFARALRDGVAPRGEQLHLVAEFVSLARGERIKEQLEARSCGFDSARALRVTLLSTEQIKNYFMVHSAFVPGVTGLYDEILAERGQEIVRIDLPGARTDAPSARVSLEELHEALRSRGCIPIAVELADGRVVLNPPPNQAFLVRDLVGAYVVTDVARLAASFRPKSQRPPAD